MLRMQEIKNTLIFNLLWLLIKIKIPNCMGTDLFVQHGCYRIINPPLLKKTLILLFQLSNISDSELDNKATFKDDIHL